MPTNWTLEFNRREGKTCSEQSVSYRLGSARDERFRERERTGGGGEERRNECTSMSLSVFSIRTTFLTSSSLSSSPIIFSRPPSDPHTAMANPSARGTVMSPNVGLWTNGKWGMIVFIVR